MKLANDETLTISHLAPLIRNRRISPVELTRLMLGRIERLQPELNAFITVTAELALEQARRAEREISGGQYRGSLHGMPITLKDLFHLRGVRTTAGSRILRNHRSAGTAPAVERLLERGCVVLGKTNLHEFAFGATNINPHYGLTRNPWARAHISGGSSGGSAAAVASGLCVASLGTDTGGSVRIPAAACGCVGLKPTWGLVPLEGVIPLAPTLDHVGPITRCVEDAAIVLGCIAGKDFVRGMRRGVRGMRIGIPRQYYFDHIQDPIRQALCAAVSSLEQAGAELAEVELPGMRETAELAADLTVGEALAYHWKWLQKRPGDYGDDLRSRMQAKRGMTVVEYLLCQERRREYANRFEELAKTVDVLAAPTLPITAPRIDAGEVLPGRRRETVRNALLRLTRPANLTGAPAISIPCGFSPEGLPIGLQLIGSRLGEAAVLRAAYAFERVTPWHLRFPPDPGEVEG